MLSRPCGAPFPHSGLLLCTKEDICSSHVQNFSLCSKNRFVSNYQYNYIAIVKTKGEEQYFITYVCLGEWKQMM